MNRAVGEESDAPGLPRHLAGRPAGRDPEQHLGDVELRRRPQPDVGGREPRVDFDGVILRPVRSVAEHQIDADVPAQSRNAADRPPCEPDGPFGEVGRDG